ncbi:hypothetical protein SLA2020_290500 [Shorea laevis]
MWRQYQKLSPSYTCTKEIIVEKRTVSDLRVYGGEWWTLRGNRGEISLSSQRFISPVKVEGLTVDSYLNRQVHVLSNDWTLFKKPHAMCVTDLGPEFVVGRGGKIPFGICPPTLANWAPPSGDPL